MQTLKKSFLIDVLKQKGYHFGQLWRIDEEVLGAVVPILINETPEQRAYVMLEELKDELKITDTGNISEFKVKSSATKPTFIRQGTAFKGQATQSRANQVSVIIMPNKEQEVPIRCIHASHGISAGATFKRHSYVPRATMSALYKGEQSEVWSSISGRRPARAGGMRILSLGRTSRRRRSSLRAGGGGSSRMYTARGGAEYAAGSAMDRTTPRSDDLIRNMEKLKESKSKSTDWIKKVPCLESQIGAVILDAQGVYSVEVFDHPQSWKAFHEGIMEKYEDILKKKPAKKGLFDFKEERVPKLIDEFINKMLKLEGREVYKANGTATFIIEEKSILGEYTTLSGNIVHIFGFRKEVVAS